MNLFILLTIGIIAVVVSVNIVAYFINEKLIEEPAKDIPTYEIVSEPEKIDTKVEEPFEDVQAIYELEQKEYIRVSLKDMKLTLKLKGEIIEKTFNVLSIRDFGKFATPKGEFKALLKEENHFSSIGKVWMPWSIQFSGNYFIHGWPYYPDGTDVPKGYSGGCIRLSTKDAEELYGLIEVGMPILIE